MPVASEIMLQIEAPNIVISGTIPDRKPISRPDSPKLLVSDDEWLAFRKDLPEEVFARVKGGPQGEWLAAIKGDGPMPGSNFDYATELTEMILLGVIAQRFNTRIEYDAKNMRITNNKKLNDYLKEPARRGWRYGEDVWRG